MKGERVFTKVPLADKKDDLIEKWIRQTPAARSSGKLALPTLGKPVATKRGTSRLAGAAPVYQRRVIVISYHYKMRGAGYAKLHSHLRYVERPGAGEELNVTPTLFNDRSDEVQGHSVIQDWRNDRHHFRVLLAPTDGHQLDMKEYTRAYMAELETALGTKLQWMAGIHGKPDAAHQYNRHAHVILRGIDQTGADLVMDRNFIRYEMRRIAEELATKHLGQLSQRELAAYRTRQAERARTGEQNYNTGRRPQAQSRSQEQDQEMER
jgi:type IV secretory pathway VirD2 relaxase